MLCVFLFLLVWGVPARQARKNRKTSGFFVFVLLWSTIKLKLFFLTPTSKKKEKENDCNLMWSACFYLIQSVALHNISPFPLPNIIYGKHKCLKAVNGEQSHFFPHLFNLLLKNAPHNIMQPVWFGLSASLGDILADSVPVLLCQLYRFLSLICQADAVRWGFILNYFAITWENELTTSLFLR